MRIYGNVEDASSRARIAGAQVTVALDGTTIGTLYTGAEGNFELNHGQLATAKSELRCTVTSSGYEATTATRSVSGPEVRLDIELAPEAPPPPTRVTLHGTAVQASDGAPIARAHVVARLGGNLLGASTADAAGRFRIPDLSTRILDQPLTLVVTHQGFDDLALDHTVTEQGRPIVARLIPQAKTEEARKCSTLPSWLALATIFALAAALHIDTGKFKYYFAAAAVCHFSIPVTTVLWVYRMIRRCPKLEDFPSKATFVLSLASAATLATYGHESDLPRDLMLYSIGFTILFAIARLVIRRRRLRVDGIRDGSNTAD